MSDAPLIDPNALARIPTNGRLLIDLSRVLRLSQADRNALQTELFILASRYRCDINIDDYDDCLVITKRGARAARVWDLNPDLRGYALMNVRALLYRTPAVTGDRP